MTDPKPDKCYFIERKRWFDSVPSYVRVIVDDYERGRASIRWTEDATVATSFSDQQSAEAFVVLHPFECVLGHAVCHGFIKS